MVMVLADTELEKLAPPGPPALDDANDSLVIQGDPKAPALGEVGVSGLKIFSGYVNEEYLPELRGPSVLKIYRTMADDSIVNAVITAITLILRAVDWRVEPAEGNTSAQAEAEAEFARGLLDDMSHTWEDFISEAMSMLIYGWSLHEIVLKKRVGPDETDGSKRSKYTDGRIGVRRLPIRSQDSLQKWAMQDDGGVAGMWQQAPAGGPMLLIPIERALLIRTTSRKNSPEGVSILRSAYRPWYLKRGIEDMEAIGIERELAGLPVVSIPQKYLAATASDEDKAFAQRAQTIARDLKFNQQGGVVIPSETFQDNDGKWSSIKKVSIELLTTGGRRAIETSPIVTRYNRDIARAALADFLTLGDEKGSYALSKNKSELFLRACETYLNQIAAVMNRFLLPRIFAYNGIDHALMPTLKPGRVTPVDLNELGTYIQALAGAGAPLFPNQDLSNYLADVAGLPEPPEDIGLMATPGQQPGPGHIDPNTGNPIQPKIDPNTGMLQHEVDRQKAQDALDAAAFMDDNRGPASKRGSGEFPFDDLVGKFNERHDERGRFDFATGGPTVSFVSPNTKESNLDQAQRDLNNERQRELADASFAIDGGLGLHSDTSRAIGAWADGAEPSLMFSSSGGNFEQVKMAAAMKGYLANQKAVLVFQPGAAGDNFMANFEAKGDVSSIHDQLLKDGLAFHTLVPTRDGAKVYIYGQGQDDLDKAGAAARGRGQKLGVVTGHGEFVGTTKQDGTDAEQRADAKRAYSQVIDAGLSAGYGGSHGATRWSYIQRHWGQTLKRLIAKYNERHDHLGRFDFRVGIQAKGLHEAAKKKKQWIEQSPIQSVDDLYAGADENKATLDASGAQVEADVDHGIKYKAPGVKGRDRVLEKIAEGRKPAGVTDVVRATFVAPTPEQADAAVADLAKRFPVTDEGYRRTDAGYVDRAVNVHFPNGQIGEVLLMNPEMSWAKSPDGGGGHDLYAASRSLPNGDPVKAKLEAQQRRLYGAAVAHSSPAWKAVFGS